jgi:uncharacterized protein
MRISVKVKPSSGKQLVTALEDAVLLVHIRSAPENGKANAEVIKVVAKHFGVRAADVSIVVGATNRSKVLEVNVVG